MTDIHWMADQVIYQIFPDRFAIGHPHSSETKLALPAYKATTHHEGEIQDYKTRAWHQLPVNDPPDDPPLGKDFFGGDLNGIVDHLDHILDLGITTLFLNPVFHSPSNHKYDTADYFKVDEQFGGDQGLQHLINACRNHGIHLILDAVLNHVSDIHPWFKSAEKGIEPERSFFTFCKDGNLRWRDNTHLPELDLLSPILQNILFRNDQSALQKYLSMGIDGWRFDTATDFGLDLARTIRHVILEKFPHAVLIGEVTNFGAEWVNGERFHGIMNYYFSSVVLDWLGGQTSARQMNCAAEEYTQEYGMEGALCSWNILSSHDTPRLKHRLPETWQRTLAVVAQFTLPGIPVVYYGEEIGMQGGDDPDCRRSMIWEKDRWDTEPLALFKQMISIRKSRTELRRGTFKSLSSRLDRDALVFLRYTEVPHEVSLVVLNSSDENIKQRLMVPHSHLYDGLWMKNLLEPGSPCLTIGKGFIDLNVPPRSAAILVPNIHQYKYYSFYKEGTES